MRGEGILLIWYVSGPCADVLVVLFHVLYDLPGEVSPEGADLAGEPPEVVLLHGVPLYGRRWAHHWVTIQ